MKPSELRQVERVRSPFARTDDTVEDSVEKRRGRMGETTLVTEPNGELATPAVRRLGIRAPRRLSGLRPMTGYEEQLIEELVGSENTALLCNKLLARCSCRLGDDLTVAERAVDGLLVAERDMALVDLRRLTFGDQVESRIHCPLCGKLNVLAFSLTRITLDAEDVAERLEVRLTDGRVAHLRLHTARDQADLLGAGLESVADRRTWLLERSIESLGDLTGPLGFDAAHALDSGTRFELERELERAIPDVDLSIATNCHACDHAFTAPFEVESFFLPR